MLSYITSILIASSYVFSIYFHQPSFLITKYRNDVEVIHYRLTRVTILCISLLLVFSFKGLRPLGLVPGFTLTHSFFTDIFNIIRALILIVTLYIGPIVNYLENTTPTSFIEDFSQNFLNIHGFRDHIFAPLTEEFIYRALILDVAGFTWWSPFLFGIAHIHHAYFMYNHSKLPPSMIIFNTIFQTTYTTLFGLLANHLFVKYQNLWCCVVVHAVCNLMGFPGDVQGGKGAKVRYWIGIVVGIMGFIYILRLH